ncbi:YSIRK-type signal peptide-containing protein [Lactobacillus crispatus]|uniref:mucin-binding protein n=3 Tax=Lactobacillus crispatus TaxID=47770 RepID=UPI0011905929|nr:YSIRK-type signal peptide-containing protein [Lactobacillus crispatus]TVS30822.1 YSIRK-type signal peptide-containing protein [Lactobacillus crispatus]
MLFNKHSETKQRFGIRKLTIGATSVLLSTLFLTVNNGQKVHAATNETVTSTDNKSGTEDNTATTEEKQTGDVATTADKSSDTSTPEDKVSSEGKTEDVTNTEEVTKPASGQKKFATTDKTMKIFTKMLVAAPAPSTDGLSDDGLVATDDQGVTLSMSKNTLGEGGQLGKSGITVKLSGTVNAGDIYTIQVPDFGWGYNPLDDSTITAAGALGNFATAKKTKVVIDGQNYANYQITFKQGITIDSKGFQIVLNNGNNYYGQGRPSDTIKDGIYDQNIYWSRSSQADPTKITENSSLSFTRKVETGFNKPTFNLTAPDGNKVSALAPDTDYQFTLNINQGTGLNGLTDFTAAQINSARNYGSVITIPVPKGFVLNQDVSLKNSQIGDETTIEQVGGAGGNIIIKVPEGSGRQHYEGKPGYVIVGRFINHPETTSTFRAADNITVTEKVLTKDGTKEIKAVLPPWQITLKGAKDKPSEGEFGVQAWGNNNGNIFTQTVPTKIANYFNFTNNTALAYENNLHLTFDFDDGLAINALSTPKINDVDRYGTRSYTYTLTLTDGTKVTGTIDAGGKIDVPTKTMTVTVKEKDDEGKEVHKDVVVPVTIKSADLVPDFWAAGAHGDGILNYRTGGNFGTNQLISDETFMAYGYISDVLNNDLHLPKDTKVKSTLTVSSPAYRPDTKFYATDTQTVLSKDSIKSALGASANQNKDNRYYSPDIDYTKGKYGTIGISTSDDSRKASNRIVEPIFYYVLPAYTNFTGDLTNIKDLNPGITDGDKSKENIKPKLTSYMVGNQQVVKLDYSGTGFVYDASKGNNTNPGGGNILPIAIDADAEPGVYKWNVYLFTQTGIVNHDAITNTSDVANKYTQNVVQEAEKAGKSGSLYMIGDGNWEIKTPPVAYAPNTVQGNLDVKSVANGKSDDKGSEEMNYATEIANYSTGTLKDPYMLINFPQASPDKNNFTYELTGPEEFIALNNNLGKDDFTTYYSTKTQALPNVKERGRVPDMTGYVTADQVTDWSKIKSAVIKFNTTLPGGTVFGQIVFKGKDPTLKTDADKTSYFRAAVMGETINPFLTENTSIKVVGKSTVNTRLHYRDADGQDHYINVPTMTKEYNDNVDTMESSHFALNNIPKELIPDHYKLVANQTPSIINNEDGNSKDATAEFNNTVTYAFDGDTVQFELTPKIDKATQSIKHVVHFVTNDSSAHQLFDDQAVDVTVTQATNEVTGKKTYAASYMENGKEVSLSVTKLDDGQISITFPAATIPSSKEYYVVDNTEDQANALTHTFTFTANSNSTIENFVKYAPVKQKLQVQVYDDDSKTALDTKDTGAKIEFIGNSNAAFPTDDLQTNLDKLKTYYEDKNYIVTLPSASGSFDDTDNGPDKDKEVQVIEVHLTHAKDVKTEQVNAVRNVTYSGAGDLTPAEKTDTAQNVFSRTVTTDLVTNIVTKSQWTGSHTFAGIDTPSVAGYHADNALAGNIEVTADSLNKADTATLAELMKNGVVVSDHVTYAPDHQELKIRVHDDTTNQDLSPVTAQSDLKDTIAISADGHTDEATPADFSNNIDKLKKYYKSKGYEIVSTSEVPAKFDNTSNGTSTTDKTPQYVDIHLEHALKLEKESKEITRTINFYDQDQNKLIHDANPNLPQYQQTVTQIVKFDRYIVRDEVTGQIIGYATPSQVTVDSTGQAQLVQKDGYTHAIGESSDKTAGFVSPANYDKYNSYNNYDLSRYGYEAPTDVDGNSYSQVAAATPKATDSDSVVNVYYREKVVTVTVDNPPTPGTPIVPGSDVRYPKNDWNKQTATSESTRIIHYIYDDNTFVNGKDVSRQPVPGLDDIKQTVTFTQSAKINLVTGVVSYQGDWKPKDSSIYAEVVSPNYKTNPSLTGYTPHQEIVNAAKATYGANAGDVFVRYVANNSLVQVEYVDKDTGDTLKVDKKTGKSGETFTYSTADLIKEYEKQGYELDHDGYTLNDGHLNQLTFDSYDDVPYGQYPAEIKQKWTVYLTHKTISVTSDQPKDSTEKITTPDGYDHNYPSGVGQNDLNNTVKRTISSVYTDKPDGPFPFPSVEQDVSYRRKATIDLVKLAKGDKDAVTYSNWEPAEAGKESFTKNPVPVKTAYVADYEVVPSQDVPKDKTGKAENGQNVVVKYSPVGKIIPVDKEGNTIPSAPTPSYSNDSHDPTKVTNTPVPEIPGYHAEISEVTPNPNKPGENTKVVYVKNKQTIDLTYVDTTTNKTLTTQANVAQGDSDSAIPASVTDTLNATTQSYLDKGYVIDASKPQATVPTNFDSSSQNPDGTDAEHQVVTVYLTHGKETITANDPKNPGDPINEKDPNGAKYPPEASKSNLTISSQNIVHYKGAGEQTPKDSVVTDDNTLTRTVTIDKVTGDVLPETSAWQGEKDYDDVATPVVTGYFADKKTAGESKVTTADVERAKDGVITNETTVVYKPMGKIIPVDKNGNPIPNSPRPIFNNDPQDPTKASKTNTPEIPGYHTEISEVTPDPDNPGKDREVVYVADSQKVLIQVYDKDSKTPNQPLDTSKTNVTVSFNGDSFTNFPTSAATSVDDLIKYYESCGYKVENKPTAEELAAKFDGDKTVDQYLKLTLVHDTETITGENPKKVGDPINPADPDSKKYGEQTSKENLVIASEVTIDYDGAGKKTPTKSVRTNDRALTRSVTIDKVTGAVISTSDWTGGANYDAVTTPKIPGYTADLESAGKASITSADYNDAVNGVITRKFKVVYIPEKQELQLKVYDQDLDKYLGKTDSFYGLTDQEVGEDPQTRLDELKKQFAERGFDIVEVPELAKNYDNTENGTSDQDNKPQVFVLVVKHHIETVTPDDPKTPDDKIPNTNQNYPGGLTETDLSKTITRTIIVHMPDGSTKEIKQEVVYTRTATVDSVTKEVTYTDWTSKNSNWSEYQSPDIPGYTVDIEKVELAKVPVDGHDVTVEINYTADPVPDEPVNPSNPGNPGTTTPDQPQQPGKPTDPTKPSEPNKPSNPGRPTNPNHPTKPTKPVTPAKPDQTHDQHSKVNGETDLNGFVDGISDEKAGAVAGASDNAQAGAKKLPQTSGESGWQASLLGMGLFFISLFGFKKKKEDE